MKAPWRRPTLPDDVRETVELGPGEKVLSWTLESASTAVLVATTHRLYAVQPASGGEETSARVLLDRPWHRVEKGTWDKDDAALTVTWVDRRPPARWVLEEPYEFGKTFRERVQASVVVGETLDLPGRGEARVAVRKDLATGELMTQSVLGTGVRMTDPGVAEAVRAAQVRLREQVGLPY